MLSNLCSIFGEQKSFIKPPYNTPKMYFSEKNLYIMTDNSFSSVYN